MKHTVRPILCLLLFFLLLPLVGCSSQPSTVMTINEGFSGERSMEVSIGSGELERLIPGGQASFDAFLEQHCPQALSWKAQSVGNYLFVLSFSSEEEYREKVASLLGRDPYLLYATPDGLFTQGVRLEEDFTSQDLLEWLDRDLVSAGLCAEEPGFTTKEGCRIIWGKDSYSCNDPIQVRELTYQPVDKVTILTKLIDNQSFERTVTFFIPQGTLDRLGEQVAPYMQQRIPDGGSGIWEDTATGRSFAVHYSADRYEQLQQKTSLVLDSTSSQTSLDEEKDTLFNSRILFTEALDFSSFLSNRNGKTYVEYLFEADSTSGVSHAQLWKNSRWTDVESYLSDGQFLFQDDSSLLQVRLKSHNEYQVGGVSIQMKKISDGTFHREIALDFSGDTAERGAQTAAQYFSGLSIPDLNARADGSRCTITIQGAAAPMSQALSTLLGSGNGIALQKGEGFQLFHTDSMEDQIDLRQFLNQIGYSGAVSYTYQAEDGYSSLVQEEDSGSQSFRPSSNGVTRQLPESGLVTMTAVKQQANGWFVLMLCAIAGASLGVILFVFLMLHRRSQRLNVQTKPILDEDFPLLGRCCPACGAPLYEGMHFCVKCGTPSDIQSEDVEELGGKQI